MIDIDTFLTTLYVRNSKTPWPKALRRWRAGMRQIVATVYDKLFHTWRLDRERPHELSGVQARLAAKNCVA
jgi:hypothetical protein